MATVGLVIDIAIIVAILVFALIGLKKGFLKSVLSLCSWVVCIFISSFLAKYVANFVNKIFDFSGLIAGKINSGLGSEGFWGTAISTFSDADSIISQIPGDTNGVFKQLIKVVFSNIDLTKFGDQTVGAVVSSQLGNICMVVICGVVLFLLLKLLVFLLTRLIDKITKGKVVGKVDKALGLAFGTLKAVVIVLLFNSVLVTLTLVPVVNKTVTPLITENTTVEKFIYQKTDKLFEHYVIDGEIMQKLVSNLWNSR